MICGGSERRLRGELPARWAHLSALSGLAYAQPVYDVLESDPAALVAVDATGSALILLVAGIALGPPLLMIAIEAVVGAVRRALARVLHLIFVGSLIALFVLQSRVPLGLSGGLALTLGLAAGVLGSRLYRRSEAVRSGLLVVAPAPLIFAAILISTSPVSSLLDPGDPGTATTAPRSASPVVIVVFDELPLPSLLDRRARIDRERFPALARLARDGTWFRNTTSVDGESAFAVPAILAGRKPDPKRLPISSKYPHSIFTLLGASHELHVEEPITRICPPSLCPRRARSAPATAWSASNQLSNYFAERLLPPPLDGGARRAGRLVRELLGADPRGGYLQVQADNRVRDFRQLVSSIHPSPRPGLYVLHTVLPHRPWNHLPSGRRYGGEIRGARGEREWKDNSILVAEGWQRHLLELSYADRLFASLLRRLDRAGLYERALIVAVADHGLNFTLNGSLRDVTRDTVEQLAPVPLIVKAPGQRRGRVSQVPLETVDVLPTIADALDIRLPWSTDGVSGFRTRATSARVSEMSDSGQNHVTVPRARLAFGGQTLARRLALFGSGDPRALFTLGASPGLIGRPLARRQVAGDLSDSVRLEGAERFRHVGHPPAEVPADVAGDIEDKTPKAGRPLAITVNGRAWAITRSFLANGRERFTSILPERAFRPGPNEVGVLALREAFGPREVLFPSGR